MQIFVNTFVRTVLTDLLDTSTTMSISVSNCQHCDEPQFQTLSCVHYTIFSVVKLDFFIRALLLDCIFALEKKLRAPHMYILFNFIATLFRKIKTFNSDNECAIRYTTSIHCYHEMTS